MASTVQIFLLRECAAQFYGNEMTFGFVLAAWLLWGGLGSLWASPRETTAPALVRLYLAVLILTPVGFLGLRLMRVVTGLAPGELIGPGWVFIATTALAFFLSAPVGAAFAWTAKLDGPASRTYLWESAGATAGGLLAYFLLIPRFSNAVAAALGGAGMALFVFLTFGRRRQAALFLAALGALAALGLLDRPSQRLAWRPFDLVHAEDSRYGRLQVIRTAEQTTFYDNGLKAFSAPDPASAEEAVHFALLQNPRAGLVLLVGGGGGGSLAEVLKYPNTRVDFVELDPASIRLARRFLPPEGRSALDDPRVRLHSADGRAFLERSPDVYDAILVDLPEPATAQLNRYYSAEFFRASRRHLHPGGVLSFRVPSAENYLGPALARFLATLERTLRDVFRDVRIVPGETNVFLASDGELSLDPAELGDRARALGLRAAQVSPSVLAARLDPRRVERLVKAVAGAEARLNADLRPASYFFNSVLWSAQFRGWDAALLLALASVPSRLLLDVPLALLAAGLILGRVRAGTSGLARGPLAVLGLTSMAAEVMAVVWFQARFGYVYERVALLLAVFMAGLSAGAWLALRRKSVRPSSLAVAQAAIILLLVSARAAMGLPVPEAFFFAFLGLLGFANGAFFVAAQSLFLRGRDETGRGYGWDLLGAFAGAVTVAAVLVPLAGLPLVFQALVILNSVVLLTLLPLGRRAG
jgi:spermidine synthase